jgi:hypothetical protein
MINMRRQRGLSIVSILVVLFVGILLVKGAITLVPMYWDNKLIGTILDGLTKDREYRTDMRPKDFKRLLETRLQDNNIKASLDELKIRKGDQGFTLDWTYEARDTYLGNIDMVVRFQVQKDFTQ